MGDGVHRMSENAGLEEFYEGVKNRRCHTSKVEGFPEDSEKVALT